MDGGAPKAGAGPGGGKRAVPPVLAGSDAIARAARVPRRAAFPEDDAAADAPAEAVAGAGSGAGAAGGEDDDDDVQVERFYALLDNIRAMRGAYDAGDGDGVEIGGGGARKRLRVADPPWRPAFRMEDFEEPSPTSSSDDATRRAKKTPRQEADDEDGGARAAAASASPTPPPRRAGVRLDSGRKSI